MKNITPNMVDALPVSASKVYSPRNFIFIGIYLLIAVASICAIVAYNPDSGGAVFYLLVFAIAIGIVGVLYYAFAGDKVLRTSEGVTLRTAEYFYAHGSAQSLYEALKNSDIQRVKSLQKVDEGGTRIDVIYDPDMKFAVAQIYAYQPYDYYAYKEVVNIKTDVVKALIG